MANDYTVYVHETPNGKRYVGITCCDVKRRWDNGRGYKNNRHFWRAIQKYDWSNIEHYIIFEGLTKEQAENKEIELIALWNTTNPECGYNHENGGNGKGKVTEKTKKKLAKATKDYFRTHTHPSLGTHMSEESKLKLSQSRKGIKWSSETRQKILQTKKENPYHHTKESVDKIKQSNKDNYKKWSKKVCQYNLSGEYLGTFDSIRDASRSTGVNRTQISSCCHEKSLSAGGYYWRFVLPNEIVDDCYVPREKKSTAIATPRKYQQYSIDGVLICTYDSIDALKNAGFDLGSVRRCCQGLRNTYKGYVWEFQEDDALCVR